MWIIEIAFDYLVTYVRDIFKIELLQLPTVWIKLD